MKVSHLRLPLPPQFCSSAACSFVSRPSPAVPRPEQASVDAVHQRPARGGLQLSLISSQPIQPTDLVLFWFWSVQFCDVCCLFILWDVAWLSFEAQILDGSQFSGFSRLILRNCQTWQNFRNTKNWFVSTQNNATACNSGQSLTCCLVHITFDQVSNHSLMFFVIFWLKWMHPVFRRWGKTRRQGHAGLQTNELSRCWCNFWSCLVQDTSNRKPFWGLSVPQIWDCCLLPCLFCYVLSVPLFDLSFWQVAKFRPRDDVKASNMMPQWTMFRTMYFFCMMWHCWPAQGWWRSWRRVLWWLQVQASERNRKEQL